MKNKPKTSVWIFGACTALLLAAIVYAQAESKEVQMPMMQERNMHGQHHKSMHSSMDAMHEEMTKNIDQEKKKLMDKMHEKCMEMMHMG